MGQRPRLAITLGDPCGIGPELLIKTLPSIAGKWRPTVYGTPAAIELLPAEYAKYGYREGILNIGGLEIAWLDPCPGVSSCDLPLGTPSALSGLCSVEAVRLAALDVMAGRADALLTLPISKAAARMAGYAIPGHTELLKEITRAESVRMAFIGPRLKVLMHSTHQSLRSAIDGLDAGAVAETLIFAARHLSPLLKIASIRVALCALNPHAGEHGAFGTEETLLEQSIKTARSFFDSQACEKTRTGPVGAIDGHPAFFGPCPADSVFLRASRGGFDVVVALYHDQGLIPIKLLEPESAVNVTLGLPFIRTSPDHGTAFDIAGKWVADAGNTLAASDLALALLR